jgi:hypothetical protein
MLNYKITKKVANILFISIFTKKNTFEKKIPYTYFISCPNYFG